MHGTLPYSAVFFLLKFSVLGDMLPKWWDKLDYVFLFISLVAVYHAASHAATRNIKLLLWLFWVFFAIAIVFQPVMHWMAYIASAGLIGTHVTNIRKHRMAVPGKNEDADNTVIV